MTYHHNITQYRSLKSTHLWTERMFLLVLLITLLIAAFNSSILNVLFALPALGLVTSLVILFSRRRKVSFIEIEGGVLNYLNTAKGEMVSVPVHEITHISTRFCQLNIPTAERIHILNLDMVRNEKTRWEIKEMIRESARIGVGFKREEVA